jgi:hypothetical protein
LETQPGPGGRIAVERLRPDAVHVHRRPAVDETHQVEGAAEDGGVVAHPDRRGVRDLGAVEGFDDAPFAQDALVAVRWRAGRRHPQHAAVLAAADLVDDVLGAAGQEPGLQWFPDARQLLTVHPVRQACGVDVAHRLPTVVSR